MTRSFIAPDEMDAIAESVLSRAGMPTVWQGTVTKTDIDTLIEFEYGLDILWEDIDRLAPGEEVLAAIFPMQKKICMNETKKSLFEEKMGTLNFSKAHELGHWILHVTKQQEYEQLSFTENQTFFCRSVPKKSPQEIQADMFAASILMPKNIICAAVNELKESGKVSFPDLYKLKDEFEVSISALTARVQDLNLLYISNRKVYLSEDEALGQITIS